MNLELLNIYWNYYYFKIFNNNFNGLRIFLNSIPNINEGGCGLAAYIMKNYIKKGKIVCYHQPSFKYDIKCNNTFSSPHIYLKIENKFYDSERIYTRNQVLNLSKYSNHKSLYTYDDNTLLKSIKNPSIWNSDFKYRQLLLKLFKIK